MARGYYAYATYLEALAFQDGVDAVADPSFYVVKLVTRAARHENPFVVVIEDDRADQVDAPPGVDPDA